MRLEWPGRLRQAVPNSADPPSSPSAGERCSRRVLDGRRGWGHRLPKRLGSMTIQHEAHCGIRSASYGKRNHDRRLPPKLEMICGIRFSKIEVPPWNLEAAAWPRVCLYHGVPRSLRDLAWISSRAEIAKHLRQAERRRARIGRGDQRDFRIGDSRKSILGLEHAVLGQDRDLGQNADADADGDRGLDADQAWGSCRPCATPDPRLRRRGSCAYDKGSPARTSRAASGSRRKSIGCFRLVTQCRRSGHAAMPPLSPGVALEQREVELAALDRAARLHTEPTAHVEPQTRA